MLLTRFPVRWERFSNAPPDHARSVWANPVVGFLIGGTGGVVLLVASSLGLPAPLSALLAVTAQVLATGAFHEDGLADVADGFGGGQTREAKLEIMKDSRIGTFGGVALILALGLRVGAIGELSPVHAACGLVASGAASRAAIVGMLRFMKSVRPVGLGAALRPPTTIELSAALALGAAPALIAFGAGRGLFCLATASVAVSLLAWIAHRQIGGYTGDVLGAGQQIAEVFLLLALAGSAAA